MCEGVHVRMCMCEIEGCISHFSAGEESLGMRL